MHVERDRVRPTDLFGLVVSGGDSRRMGEDKGSLHYHAKPQARHLHELLSMYVTRTYVSVNAEQRSLPGYADLPLIVDPEPRQGPATGLLAAHRSAPRVAWLAVAVDLICIDEASIGALVRGRQPGAAATAMRHPDGTIEPLFAIWEPAGLELLAERASRGEMSPRRCLEAADARVLPCPNPEVLKSVDSPRDRDAVLAKCRERFGRKPGCRSSA